MSLEERDYREHPPVVVIGFRQTELRQDAVHMLLDRPLGDPEAPANSGVRPSLSHQREHLPLAGCQLVKWIVDPSSSHQFLNESRIHHGATAQDTFDPFA